MTKARTYEELGTNKAPALMPGANVSPHPAASSMRAPVGYNNNQRLVTPQTRDFGKPMQGSLYNELAHNAVRDAIADLDTSGNWFSPFQPVTPFGPPGVNYPRTFDYQVGTNLNFSPGRLQLFQLLRGMSRSWGLLRTVIETRKDQFMRMPYAFQVKDKPRAKSPHIDKLNEFFRRPDGKNTFTKWRRLLLEDLLVIDAATIFKWKSMTGVPLAIEVIDGSTIKCLIDDAGRRPTAPDPAFQQIIKGLPMTNWSEDDIRYMPMRPVPEQPMYGYSPVEQIMAEITAGIKRLSYQVSFWTEGSMPELIVTAPPAWTPSQIAQYQGMFDAMMSGNTPYKSKVRFMPGDMKPFDIKNANGEALKAEIDEWWARLICYAFGVSPQPFIKMMNRSTAQSAQQASEEEGLHPLMLWFKEEVMDPIVQEDFGYDELEFNFLPNPEVDQQKQMTILTGYVKEGVMERNEARDQLGLDHVQGGDELIVDTPNGPVPLKEAVESARTLLNDAPNEVKRKQQAHTSDMAVAKRPPPTPVVAPAPARKPAVKKGVGEEAEDPFDRETAQQTLEDDVAGVFEANRDKVSASVISMLGLKHLTRGSLHVDEIATQVSGAVDLSGFDKLVDPVESQLEPATRAAGRGIITELGVTTGSPFEQVHTFALNYARNRAAEMIGMTRDAVGNLIPNPDAEMAITESTRNMIRSLVVKALSPQEGEPFNLTTALEELRDDLSGGYIFSRERAAVIAQFEINDAHSQGELAGMLALEQFGLEMEKKWSTAQDDKVCAEICAENAAAGFIPVKNSFPSGHRAPLGHPKCRCALIGRVKPKEN